MRLKKPYILDMIRQIPIIVSILGYLSVKNYISEGISISILIFWTCVLVSYYIGARVYKKILVQFVIACVILLLFAAPNLIQPSLNKKLILRDDLSTIEIELYTNQTFKSTSFMVMGFYENWDGEYKYFDDSIYFSSPYYDAGGENIKLYKDATRKRWVRKMDDLNRRLESFEYFVEF